MKTRKSLSGKDVLESVVSGGMDSPTVVVRKLRSRTITSDTEDDSNVRTKTPKSTRKSVKVNPKSSPLSNNEVCVASPKPKGDVGLETRTPKQNKRLSSVNLFRIVEVKEEIDMEDCEGKVKDENVENLSDEVTRNDDEDSGSVASRDVAPCVESGALAHGIVKTEIPIHEKTERPKEETEEDTYDGESRADAIQEEEVDKSKKNVMGGVPMEWEIKDFDSDGDIPEAVSLSSSKTTIKAELSLAAGGVRKKEKRKQIKMDWMHQIEKEDEEGESKEDYLMEGKIKDFDRNDNIPEAVSFSSSKNTICDELSLDAGGVRKKEKRKQVKMIRMNKIGKEGEEDESNKDVLGDEPMEGEIGDIDSDDDVPEAVSFSSSKNTINAELSLIAEAVRKEKEKKKEFARKKIEMIRMQKAEKEKKRQQKMKILDVSIPGRLAEEVTSNLPDVPDIPTVKKSDSSNRKRKNEKKVEKLENEMEKRKNKILKFDDYIPITGVLGSTQFGVVPLEVAAKIPKPSSQTAAEFKQKALYGSRIQREPSKNLLIYRKKLSAAGRLHKGFKSSSILKV